MKLEKVIFDDVLLVKEILRNSEKKENLTSNILLFRDYMSKLYDWKDAFGVIYSFGFKKKKFHNLFADIEATWAFDIISLDDFFLELVNAGLPVRGGKFFDDLFVYMFIFWEKYSENIEISSHRLENPYIPAFELLKRTGSTHSHNGLIQIDNFIYKDLPQYRHFKLPSLDENFLDYVDQHFTLRGSVGFPNQSQVDECYREYCSQLRI
jgi:hypothetical protein